MKIAREIEAIELPDNIKDMPPMQQLALFWGVISVVLHFVKIFTGAKADEKIDAILEWGNENLK